MSFPRSIAGVVAIALIATVPALAGAQARARTVCSDGTRTASTASDACDGHGGVHKGNSEFVRRQPGSTNKASEPARVAQAGSPTRVAAPAPNGTPRYEERRGWRWGRHHDEPEHSERRERRYRCRDGKLETVHGKAKGREVCKHHGGIAN